MGNDFFSGIGAAIAKTAKIFTQKAENLYEVQKIRNQLSGEEQLAEKAMLDIGRMIYTRYEQGDSVDGELGALCEEISQHMQAADHCRDAIAAHNGEKYCPACHKVVMREANFCPYCGAACPTPELEDHAGDVIEQIDKEMIREAEVVENPDSADVEEHTEDIQPSEEEEIQGHQEGEKQSAAEPEGSGDEK